MLFYHSNYRFSLKTSHCYQPRLVPDTINFCLWCQVPALIGPRTLQPYVPLRLHLSESALRMNMFCITSSFPKAVQIDEHYFVNGLLTLHLLQFLHIFFHKRNRCSYSKRHNYTFADFNILFAGRESRALICQFLKLLNIFLRQIF